MDKELKIEKWWESKITFLIATVAPLVVVLAFLFGMQKDIAVIQSNIANINSNHEVHIQDIQQSIKDLQQEQVEQNRVTQELQKQIISQHHQLKGCCGDINPLVGNPCPTARLGQQTAESGLPPCQVHTTPSGSSLPGFLGECFHALCW